MAGLAVNDRPGPTEPLALSLGILRTRGPIFHSYLVLGITFLAYASLHASRKPPSIVKSVLGPDPQQNGTDPLPNLTPSQMGWAPFNGPHGTHRLGELDLAFLSAYAVGMFVSGRLADKFDLRVVLSAGMLLSGVFTVAFGAGYWFDVHEFWYYIVVQFVCGLVQSAGWPCVVSAVGNWWSGSTKKGVVMGVWNSHTSVGNIVGSIVAAEVLGWGWGWCFLLPGLMVMVIAMIVFVFLVVSRDLVGLAEVELNGAAHRDKNPDEAERLRLLNNENAVEGNEGVVPSKGQGETGFFAALRQRGVVPFAVCLFFSKLVAYTFLYWLPFYIRHTAVAGEQLSHKDAGRLSVIFDCGGVIGGIVAGVVSDKLMSRAKTSISFLITSIPALLVYRHFGSISMLINMSLMFIAGLFVNGPYALITTAVAADLGAQNPHMLATVTAIIDGTGSIGAAIGPPLVGYISTRGWDTVFYMLTASMCIAAVSLSSVVNTEINEWKKSRRQANGAALSSDY